MRPGTSCGALDPGGEDRFQRLRAELGITTAGLDLLRLQPGQAGRGDITRVAPGVRRQLGNRSAQEVPLPEDPG